jgi:hypothetical protein
MHTYILTHAHTYIHTYIHAGISISLQVKPTEESGHVDVLMMVKPASIGPIAAFTSAKNKKSSLEVQFKVRITSFLEEKPRVMQHDKAVSFRLYAGDPDKVVFVDRNAPQEIKIKNHESIPPVIRIVSVYMPSHVHTCEPTVMYMHVSPLSVCLSVCLYVCMYVCMICMRALQAYIRIYAHACTCTCI